MPATAAVKQLTAEQQKIVEKYYNLVYIILNQMNLGICKAALHWDGKTAAFATYASYVMRNEIFEQMRKENKLPKNTISLDQTITLNSKKEMDCPLQIAAPDIFESFEIQMDLKEAIHKVFSQSSAIDKKILFLYMAGIPKTQIGKQLNLNQYQVYKRLNNMFLKIKHYMKAES